MKIVNFEEKYIEQAEQIAIENYYEEQAQVSMLPQMEQLPELKYFAKNGLGVAAFEEERMIGFLGCLKPWDQAFDSSARGTFSPIHAHGAVIGNRQKIYKRMYQVAADKWIKNKIAYHAIALYAHDQEAIHAFYTYGFGMRCIDAIRPMECFENSIGKNITFHELNSNEAIQVRTLRKLLSEHFGESPCFMYSSKEQFNQWVVEREKCNHRLFVAKEGNQLIAFVEAADEAENFVTEVADMKNICGAYCLPEYRGKHIIQGLINFMIQQLRKENFNRLGVDFESFNPTASAFWPKYFQAYTNSLVRRIDECAFHD